MKRYGNEAGRLGEPRSFFDGIAQFNDEFRRCADVLGNDHVILFEQRRILHRL